MSLQSRSAASRKGWRVRKRMEAARNSRETPRVPSSARSEAAEVLKHKASVASPLSVGAHEEDLGLRPLPSRRAITGNFPPSIAGGAR